MAQELISHDDYQALKKEFVDAHREGNAGTFLKNLKSDEKKKKNFALVAQTEADLAARGSKALPQRLYRYGENSTVGGWILGGLRANAEAQGVRATVVDIIHLVRWLF